MSGNEVAIREQETALTRPMASNLMDPVTAANYIVKSGLFGNNLKPEQVVVKIMIGAEIGVAPVTAARQIHVFESQGRTNIILDATLMAALVKRSGRYDYRTIQHDDQGTVLEWTDRGRVCGQSSFTLTDAKRANLLGKAGPWSQGYARDMMFARAMSRGFDHYCPDLGCGLPIMTTEEADTLPMSHDQRRGLMAFANEQGMDRADRLAWSSAVLGREVKSWAELVDNPITRAEATLLYEARESYADWRDQDRRPVAPEVIEPVTAGDAPREEGRTEESEGSVGEPTQEPEASAANDGDWRPDPAVQAAAAGGEREASPAAGASQTILGDTRSAARREFDDVRREASVKREAVCRATVKSFLVGMGGTFRSLPADEAIDNLSDANLEALTAVLLERCF